MPKLAALLLLCALALGIVALLRGGGLGPLGLAAILIAGGGLGVLLAAALRR
jgi:hypothetical protein